MTTFIGHIEARLDDKGRTFIPASYRKILAEQGSRKVVVRMDPGLDCLQFLPEQVWNEMVLQLQNKLNPWKAEDRRLRMQFIGEAEVLEPDSQGRVLLQKRLLEQIGATQDVVFVGDFDRFCLWSPKRFEESMLSRGDFEEAICKRMNDI